MRLETIDKSIERIFRQCIIMNELSGDLSFIYKFSLVKLGTSGYSFGITQLDVSNNAYALLAIKEMDFTTEQINALKNKLVSDITVYNTHLLAHRDIVDKYDDIQLKECLDTSLKLLNETHAEIDSIETFMHIADYCNQIGFSRNGRLYCFLQKCAAENKEVSSEMIKDFKFSLKWGRSHPEDVYRRYKNIVNVMKKEVQNV